MASGSGLVLVTLGGFALAVGSNFPAPARTVHVVDGDTFDYGGDRIRIADIDTPETRARCPEEARLAAAATQRLRVLLAQGPFGLVRSGRDEDR